MKKIVLFVMMGILSTTLAFAQVLTDFDANQTVTFTGWPNAPTLVANPSASGINTSANCGEFVRTAEQWAHSYAILAAPLDFTTNNTFKIKVYSPIACTILLKLENQNGTATTTELAQQVNTANTWEELTFPFVGATTGVYDKIVIFFDFANTTDNTFYFDDVTFTTGGVVLDQINLPVTFELENVNYTISDFGGNSSLLGADPANALNTCVITTKNTGAETWAGSTIGTTAGFADAIPFTATETKMRIKVYAPAVGLPIRLKVEDHTNNTITCETEAITTVANAWETLEFDFMNQATGTAALDVANTYDMASIFFDFGTNGTGAVYYFDDVEFGGLIGMNQVVNDAVQVYPNPASNNVTIKGLANQSIVRVYSALGTLIDEVQANEQVTLSVTDWSIGVYMIFIQSETGTITQRLIKH